MNLVEEYYMLVSEVVSNKESVHDNKTAEEHNNKVNRMCAIAMIIEQAAPELKSDFFKLISNENSEIRLWVAHHILEYMNYDRYFRKCALREIRHKARMDHTVYGFGERVWLKDWYKTHPQDRWI